MARWKPRQWKLALSGETSGIKMHKDERTNMISQVRYFYQLHQHSNNEMKENNFHQRDNSLFQTLLIPICAGRQADRQVVSFPPALAGELLCPYPTLPHLTSIHTEPQSSAGEVFSTLPQPQTSGRLRARPGEC